MLTRFPNPKGMVYTIDLRNLEGRENPRTVEAPFYGTSVREETIVDWGDGTSTTFGSETTAYPPHTYADDAGDVFRVVVRSVNGNLPLIRTTITSNGSEATNPSKNITWAIVSLDHFNGTQRVTTLQCKFIYTKNLKYVDPNILNAPGNPIVTAWFSGCVALSQPIESFTFEFMENISAANALFFSTSVTGTIPSRLFGEHPQLTSFASTFVGCTGLTGSIPPGLFDGCPNVTSFAEMFNGCSGLTGSIPVGLFDNNTAVTSFTATFRVCSGLTGSIPAGLFDHNTEAQTFTSTFMGCSNLTGQIPSGLFDKNTKATNFASCFESCRGLTGQIPSGLFDNNTAITNVSSAFRSCEGLTAPYKFWEKSYAASISSSANCYNGCSGMDLTLIPTTYGGTMTIS